MKKIVQRYVGVNFILPFIVSCLFFISFLLTFQLFQLMKVVINKRVEVLTILELIGHIAITFLPMSIPLAILFASIYSLNKLSSDVEFLAMRSFGISINKLFIPCLMVGIFIGGAIFALSVRVIPESKMNFREIITELSTKGVLTDIKEGQFFIDIPNSAIYANHVYDKGRKMQDIFIHAQEKNKTGERIIMAKDGELVTDIREKTGRVIYKLHLKNGNIVKRYFDNKDIEKIIFKDYIFPLNEGVLDPEVDKSDSMKTIPELYQIIFKGKEKWHLTQHMDNEHIVKSEIEFWGRINTPILCVIFTLLGFALGIQNTRGKEKQSGLYCAVVLILYYALYFTGVSLARKGMLPPIFIVFFPSLLALVSAGYFYRKLEWAA